MVYNLGSGKRGCRKMEHKKVSERVEFKEFKASSRSHRRKLKAIAKRDVDFDWCGLHEYVCQKIRNMAEFYEKGNCVVQNEDSRQATLNSLRKAVAIIDELENCWKGLLSNVSSVKEILENKDPERTKAVIECTEKEANLFKTLYCYIGTHLREWWD